MEIKMEQRKKWNPENQAKKVRCFSLKFFRSTESDVIKHLESKENIQGYIRELILKDMKEASNK